MLLGLLLGSIVGTFSVFVPGLSIGLLISILTPILVTWPLDQSVSFIVTASFIALALEVIPTSMCPLTFELQASVDAFRELGETSIASIELHLQTWWSSAVVGTVVAVPLAYIFSVMGVRLSLGTAAGYVLVLALVVYLVTSPDLAKNLLYTVVVGFFSWLVLHTQAWSLALADAPIVALIAGLLILPPVIYSLVTGAEIFDRKELTNTPLEDHGMGGSSGVLAGLASAILPALPASTAISLMPQGYTRPEERIRMSAEASGWSNSVGVWLPLFGLTGAHSATAGYLTKFFQSPTFIGVLVVAVSIAVAAAVTLTVYRKVAKVYSTTITQLPTQVVCVISLVPLLWYGFTCGNPLVFFGVLVLSTVLGGVAKVMNVDRRSALSFMTVPFILSCFGF